MFNNHKTENNLTLAAFERIIKERLSLMTTVVIKMGGVLRPIKIEVERCHPNDTAKSKTMWRWKTDTDDVLVIYQDGFMRQAGQASMPRLYRIIDRELLHILWDMSNEQLGEGFDGTFAMLEKVQAEITIQYIEGRGTLNTTTLTRMRFSVGEQAVAGYLWNQLKATGKISTVNIKRSSHTVSSTITF